MKTHPDRKADEKASSDRGEAIGMMEEINDFLESMKCFVFENKRFVRLPDEELGQFYSEESYLFICKYWKVDECDEQNGDQNGSKANGNEDEENGDEDGEGSIECKLYFWQGRDANNAGWLTFTFSLKKKFKDIEIIKQNQQQENPQFLAHFKRKFIIHKGMRIFLSIHITKNDFGILISREL
jgi:hypothetical protein